MFVPLIYFVHLVFLFPGSAPVRVKQREEDPLPTHTKSNVCSVSLLCSPGLSVPGECSRTSKTARRRPPYLLTPSQMFVPLIYFVHLVFLLPGSAPVRVKQREEDPLPTHTKSNVCSANLLCSPGLSVLGECSRTSKTARRRPPTYSHQVKCLSR